LYKGKKFCEETTTADLFLFLTFAKRGAKMGYTKCLPNFGERRRCDRLLFVTLAAASGKFAPDKECCTAA
jgi:hypothetical protein